MKYALVITGVLAGIAIAAPDLVVLGYVLLIVPGLILTCAPTVFVYLAVTAIVRRWLPISAPLAATATAFAIALLLGWAGMQPWRWAAMAAYRETELADVFPKQPLKLDGHVRLERPDLRCEPTCDHLILAVLDSPGVQSCTTVTAGLGQPAEPLPCAAYALTSAQVDPTAGIFPHEPGQIVRKYPPLAHANRGQSLTKAVKAVEASWAMRLAGPERLRTAKPVATNKADWIIRLEDRSNYPTSTLRRITILDAHGTVHFRQSYRRQAIPAPLFYLGFHANISGGPASASFHLGRQILETGDCALETETAFLSSIEFPVPDCQADIVRLLRDQALQALDDPAAPSVRIDLARRYLGLFYFDTQAVDHGVIAKIVADDRVKDIDQQLANVFAKTKTPAAMRDAFVTRIGMDDTSASLRHHLAECLANLPPETFADPEPSYLALWDSPEIYRQAAPLIETLADLGPDQALPKLAEMLDTALELPHWRDRRSVIEGIRAALIRLGPRAMAATPRIRELFLRRPSPIMNNAGDADEWRFALARMGVAIEDLPVFPGQSAASIEKNCRRVADQLRRYERNNAHEVGR